MRPTVLRLGSELRLAQRLVSQQRMMGYEAGTELTLRERTAMYKLDMDALPVPSGDWATEYGKVQQRYHIHLAISSILFGGMSIFFFSRHYIKKPDLKKPFNLQEYVETKLAERSE